MANQSKQASSAHSSFKTRDAPPIPLRAEVKSYTKEECVIIKCRSNPTDSSSTTYDLSIPMFKEGNPEEWLKWVNNLKRAAKGQNITNGPAKFALARRLLDGGALIAFENAGTAVASESSESLKQVIRAVTEHVFPKSAYQKQKSYLRRFLKKPRDLSVKQFAERVIHLNELLGQFPNPSSTVTATKMPEDEILDLLEASMPFPWQKHMRLQGFKPLESTVKEFIEFCERLESTEEAPIKGNADKSTNQEGRGKSKRARTTETKKRGRSDDADNKFYCMLHGPNPNHDTKNCRSLKKHVDKVKKENPRRNDPAKVQEEMNAVYKYVQKKMADDRKKADRDRSAREKELNEFSDMSLEKKDSNDENDEEY